MASSAPESGSGAGGESLSFGVESECAGRRLDVALSDLTRTPRAQVQRWIRDGRVAVNGRESKSSRRLALGDEIEARPPQPERARAKAQELPLAVLYEDSDLIVIDKASGMVVHPAPGHPDGTLVNALLHHCRDLSGVGGVLRPGIVHRLDRGTSGVMVAAKRDAAHRLLAEQFRDHTIERVYVAFVRGLPGADSGRADHPVGRHPRDRKRMSIRTESGREAHTAWSVARRFPRSGVSFLEVRPETGRTHQIRVHLSSAGLPLVGDPVYGRATGGSHGLERPALHAAVLGFTHPSGERLRFEAPLAPDLRALEATLERRQGGA